MVCRCSTAFRRGDAGAVFCRCSAAIPPLFCRCSATCTFFSSLFRLFLRRVATRRPRLCSVRRLQPNARHGTRRDPPRTTQGTPPDTPQGKGSGHARWKGHDIQAKYGTAQRDTAHVGRRLAPSFFPLLPRARCGAAARTGGDQRRFTGRRSGGQCEQWDWSRWRSRFLSHGTSLAAGLRKRMADNTLGSRNQRGCATG